MAFAFGPRYLGRAVWADGEEPQLCPTDVRCLDERRERIRVRTWIERSLDASGAGAVGLLVDDVTQRPARVPGAALVRAVASDFGLPLVELTRADVAQHLGLKLVTNAAISRHLTAEFRRSATVVRVWMSRAPSGPRTEAARYWEMPLVALAVALATRDLLALRIPSSPSPSTGGVRAPRA